MHGGDAEMRRLRWRCRRGMKELDVLLERFACEQLPHVSSAERAVFAELLELPDPQLAAYLLGNVAPADASLAQLVRRIAAGDRA